VSRTVSPGGEPGEAHERKPVPYLVLYRVVPKVVQRLEYQYLEHDNRIKRLPSRIALPVVLEYGLKLLADAFPFYHLVQLLERVPGLVQFFKTEINIEKSIEHLSPHFAAVVSPTAFNIDQDDRRCSTCSGNY